VRRVWERLADLAAAAGVSSMHFRLPATVSLEDALDKVIRMIERGALTWNRHTGDLVPTTGAF
jgi:hypothetical protein